MPPKTTAVKEPKKCKWNEAMEDALLDFLVCEIQQGKCADNSFKAKTWEDAVPLVNAVKVRVARQWKLGDSAELFLQDPEAMSLNAKKILQKFENIKKDYDVFIALRDQSGFGWNEELQVPECSDYHDTVEKIQYCYLRVCT